MSQVSKQAFRKAQCSGALAGCECRFSDSGEFWVRAGKTVAVHFKTIFGSTYYLEA
jgi:hypothetical protein